MTCAIPKVVQKQKKDNLKLRNSATKRQNKSHKGTRRRARRPKRNFFASRRFFTSEAFILWMHKFLGDLLDKKLAPKAKQAKYGNKGLLMALVLRALLHVAHLSRFVEQWQSNPWLCKGLSFRQALQNTKPLTELLLRLSMKIAYWLFERVMFQARAHGLVFGESIAVDCCFLHVFGKTYEQAKRGYSGQLKRTALGYKLWVAFSIESKLPVGMHLDSGNVGDTKHFQRVVNQAQQILGRDRLKYVMADRGFCSKKLYYWLDVVKGLKFVFRVKAGQSNAGIQNAIDALWQTDYRRLGAKERYAKTDIRGIGNRRYHLFVGRHQKFQQPLLLLTNDLSLEYRVVKRKYLSRWKVETYFFNGKGCFALGKFSSTKWDVVVAEVAISLIACVLMKAFQLLLGRRYRRFSPSEWLDRVFLHGFSFDFAHLMKPSSARHNALITALQRLFSFLLSWDSIPKSERFSHYRPAGFQFDTFLLPDLSEIP